MMQKCLTAGKGTGEIVAIEKRALKSLFKEGLS